MTRQAPYVDPELVARFIDEMEQEMSVRERDLWKTHDPGTYEKRAGVISGISFALAKLHSLREEIDEERNKL